MRLVHLIGVLGAVGLLAGCTSNIQQMEEVQATGGTPFTQALTEEYRSFVAHEKDERDWSAADYFAIKGLAAAGGQVVLPEEVGDVGEHGPALTDGRSRLMAVARCRRRRQQPAGGGARAACVRLLEPRGRGRQLVRRHHGRACEGVPRRVRGGDGAAESPVQPMAPNTYIVLFDFDRSNINQAGGAVLDQVLADAARMGGVRISATGHADRSGSEDYNMALSLRRADSVREALIAGGVSPDAITVAGRGESEPAVPTPDGVKEQANRRVEIVLQ